MGEEPKVTGRNLTGNERTKERTIKGKNKVVLMWECNGKHWRDMKSSIMWSDYFGRRLLNRNEGAKNVITEGQKGESCSNQDGSILEHRHEQMLLKELRGRVVCSNVVRDEAEGFGNGLPVGSEGQ